MTNVLEFESRRQQHSSAELDACFPHASLAGHHQIRHPAFLCVSSAPSRLKVEHLRLKLLR
jgi:hypothetical protein